MTLDIAMGGSTNTGAASARGGARSRESISPWPTSTGCRAACPCLCKVAPSVADVHVEDVHRAGGIMGILGELDRAGLLNRDVPMVHAESLEHALSRHDIMRAASNATREFFSAGARRRADPGRLQPVGALRVARRRPRQRRDPRRRSTPSPRTAASRCSHGNIALDGSIVKTAGVDAGVLKFTGPARVFESQDDAVQGILTGKVVRRRRGRHPLRRPARRPRHAGDALSDQLSEIARPRQSLRPRHRRALLRGHLGPLDRPCLAGGGGRRRDRSDRGRRPHRDRHSRPAR